jgi:predicted permease
MSWFRRFFRRAKAGAELDEEIRFYLDQETKLRIERGESPEHARQAALRAFGNVTLVKETTCQMWGWTFVEDFVRDLRLSLRLLVRSPLFTAVAVLSLALGIGANTAIFSLADAVIFRELPVRDPKRLCQVRSVHQRGFELVHSYPLYEDIRDRNQVFSSTACTGAFAILESIAIILSNGSQGPLQARVTVVSGSYFSTLGIEAVVGRTFTPDDDQAVGAAPVAVVSYRFWKQALGAEPAVMNTSLLHNGVRYQILGVAPPSFTGISSQHDPDIWFPMMMSQSVLSGESMFKARGSSSLYVFGRLKPGVTPADASADMARVYGDLQKLYRNYNGQRGEAVPMAKGVQALRERFERPLLVLLGVVGLLLLIASTNLAALLLARAVARRHEIAVRLSLGASTFRLLRQFLTESLLIALLGAVAGLLLSSWGAALLVGMVTTSAHRLPIHFTMDMRILAFTAGISILALLLFGLVPALQANRPGTASLARAHTHSRLPAARLLIAGQMALSLFLMIAAGLFIRTLVNLRHLDTGFARENVLVLMLDPRPAYGQQREKYLGLYGNLIGRARELPGVRSASFSNHTFFGGGDSRRTITYEGHITQAPRDERPNLLTITPGFPETFGLSLIAGRTFHDRDDRTAPKVALISESVAKRAFPGENPVGKRFCFSDSFQPQCAIEIVGVVGDVRYNNLRRVSPYALYVPVQQDPVMRGDLHVRTWADPAGMAAQLEEMIRRYEPGVRVLHTVTLERLVEDSIIQDRLLALVATFFAVLALVLSALGLYGITSYGVHRRTSEIGVRMALGASAQNVQWMILREVLVLVAAGGAGGIAAALAVSEVVRSLLFGLTPTDPLIIAAATFALILIALLAGYLPARNACRVDPIQALRYE